MDGELNMAQNVWKFVKALMVVYSATLYKGLTYYGLVTLYSDIDLGQHWLRQWLVAWQYQGITWTNVDLALARFNDICLRAIHKRYLSQ